MPGGIQLRTAEVARTERINYWTAALGHVCSGLQTDGYGAESLDGRIKLAQLGGLKLCDIETSRHRVVKASEAGPDVRKAVIKIVYQLSGVSIYQQGGSDLTLNPGDCLTYDVSCPHVVLNPDTSRHLVVAIPKETALLSGIHFDKTPLLWAGKPDGLLRLATRFLHAAIDETDVPAEDEAALAETILHLVRLSLHQTHRTEPQNSQRAGMRREIKRLIQMNLRDPDFTIDGLAKTLGCSKRLLHLSFAEEGLTITGYLWASRLEKCRDEIASGGSRSMTELALSWGFNSSSHFSRSFKNRFGYTPSALGKRSGGGG